MKYLCSVRQHSGDEAGQDGGGGGSESDNDYISQDDRRRIMETERLLTESEEIAGDRLPDAGAGAVRRLPGPHHSRRRRKLPVGVGVLVSRLQSHQAEDVVRFN